jgi:vitamin K-dependent gamma-carboxylase
MAIKAFANLRQRAFAPVDIASLVFFRLAFGSLMVWEVSRYFSHHRIERLWLKPDFLFTYYGFSWVHPFPGNWLYLHCGALIVAAFFIAIGFLYRPSVIFFCLGWTYTFLLDEQQWVNHIYLICLFSFLLIFVPAHRAFSIDAWLRPKLRGQTTPAWTLWILRFQMAVVYFFAGFAKLSPDWIHAVPMWQWLSQSEQPAAMHRFLIKPWVSYLFSYSGLAFDLFIVPFLLWRRTRVAAFCLALVFHLINQQIFYIEVFPLLAIAATTLFLSPSWPRRILSLFRQPKARVRSDDAPKGSSIGQSLVLGFFTVYALVQILVPLRHFLYRGGVEWYYSEHRFSWRMLVQRERTRAVYYVEDPNIDGTTRVTPDEVLEPRQAESMGWRPDEMVQFAHYLTRIMPQRGPRPLRVEARIMTSINGRKPELIIDPNVDLTAEPWPLGRPRWLREIHEPTPVRHGDVEEDPFEPDLLHINK